VITPDEAVSKLGRLDKLSDSEVDGLLEQIEPTGAIPSVLPARPQGGAGHSAGTTADATRLLSRLDDLADDEVDHLLEELMRNDD